MKKKNSKSSLMAGLAIVLAILACNVSIPSFTSGGQETPDVASPAPPATSTNAPLATAAGKSAPNLCSGYTHTNPDTWSYPDHRRRKNIQAYF